MTNNLRWLAAGVTVSAAVLLLARGSAGGPTEAWQPILPKEVYQELLKRETDIIQAALKDKPGDKAISRAKFGAVLIAALTKSVKDGVAAGELQATRDTALQLAGTLSKKGQLDAAKKLAADLPKGKADPAPSAVNWGSFLQAADLMDPYRTKDKGGDGMHADLQSNARLKGALNGIEEKILALAKKAPTAAAMDKEAKELELLGYHTAVVGSLTYYYAPPKKGKQDPQEWRKLAAQMRDNAVSLAAAAKKKDAEGVFKASDNLSSSCSQCHTAFR